MELGSRERVIAALIWLGSSLFLAAFAAPVIVSIFIPGVMRAWARHDFAYLFDVMTPSLILIIGPGAIAAGGYLFIAWRVKRD